MYLESDHMSESGYQDQSPEVIAKEILIALIQRHTISVTAACADFDEIHKQIIKSKQNNYK